MKDRNSKLRKERNKKDRNSKLRKKRNKDRNSELGEKGQEEIRRTGIQN